MKSILANLLFFLISLPGISQKSSIEFKIEKDTVLHGEFYINDVSARVAPDDSLLSYSVSMYSGPVLSRTLTTARVKFMAVFSASYDKRIMENEYPLSVKLKTLQVDTLIDIRIKYFVKPNPAYVHKLREPTLSNAEVFPDTPPVFTGDGGDIRIALSSGLLKGKHGSVAFSFVIGADGNASRLFVLSNTFHALSTEELRQFVQRTKWVAGRNKGKVIDTVYGVHMIL